MHYSKAVKLRPDVDISPALHYLLAMHYAEARRFREAILSAEKALELARAVGEKQLAAKIKKQLELFKQVNKSLKESDYR